MKPTQSQDDLSLHRSLIRRAPAGGTVDALTAIFYPVLTLDDMTMVALVSSGANTSTTPTFAPDGLTARTIVKNGGSALAAGDIGPAGFVAILQYNLANTRWELLNPKSSASTSLVEFTAAPSNQGYSGTTMAFTYGESLTPGAPVHIHTDGTVLKADANAAGKYPAIGIALETASSGSHLVLLLGIYRDDTLFAWTVGGLIYLSTTAGTLTQTQPSATDDVIQVIGIATHADRMLVKPELTWLTHT